MNNQNVSFCNTVVNRALWQKEKLIQTVWKQQTSAVIKETERGGCTVAKEKRIIYFSSGETLEEEDSEEEEEQRSDSLFRESTQVGRWFIKNWHFRYAINIVSSCLL